jgi:hypothetical protein
MKRTYVEDVFDNLDNNYGIVGFYVILAWQTNLQTRSNADIALNDLELHIGKFFSAIILIYLILLQEFFWTLSTNLSFYAFRMNYQTFPLMNRLTVLSMVLISANSLIR